jgi:hypothetical protein
MLAPSGASRLGTCCARSGCIGGTASIVLHAHLAADRGQRLDETGGAAGAATSASAGPVSPRPPGNRSGAPTHPSILITPSLARQTAHVAVPRRNTQRNCLPRAVGGAGPRPRPLPCRSGAFGSARPREGLLASRSRGGASPREGRRGRGSGAASRCGRAGPAVGQLAVELSAQRWSRTGVASGSADRIGPNAPRLQVGSPCAASGQRGSVGGRRR